MNKDIINLQEAYIKIYVKEDEDFRDQIEPDLTERIEKTYGEEIPPVEGTDEDDGETVPDEVDEKFKISTPTNAELTSKRRAPVHKPTKLIKPKKGVYNRQKFKKEHE